MKTDSVIATLSNLLRNKQISDHLKPQPACAVQTLCCSSAAFADSRPQSLPSIRINILIPQTRAIKFGFMDKIKTGHHEAFQETSK